MHPMRRKDRQMPEEEAAQLLESAEYGVLSTKSAEGVPYGVPLNYVVVNGVLYFHCAKKGHKLENIDANPRVSFCAVGTTRPVFDDDFTTIFESAIAHGRATRVTEEAEKIEALRALCEKYLPEYMQHFEGSLKSLPATEVVRMEIETVTGKAKRPRPE